MSDSYSSGHASHNNNNNNSHRGKDRERRKKQQQQQQPKITRRRASAAGAETTASLLQQHSQQQQQQQLAWFPLSVAQLPQQQQQQPYEPYERKKQAPAGAAATALTMSQQQQQPARKQRKQQQQQQQDERGERERERNNTRAPPTLRHTSSSSNTAATAVTATSPIQQQQQQRNAPPRRRYFPDPYAQPPSFYHGIIPPHPLQQSQQHQQSQYLEFYQSTNSNSINNNSNSYNKHSSSIMIANNSNTFIRRRDFGSTPGTAFAPPPQPPYPYYYYQSSTQQQQQQQRAMAPSPPPPPPPSSSSSAAALPLHLQKQKQKQQLPQLPPVASHLALLFQEPVPHHHQQQQPSSTSSSSLSAFSVQNRLAAGTGMNAGYGSVDSETRFLFDRSSNNNDKNLNDSKRRAQRSSASASTFTDRRIPSTMTTTTTTLRTMFDNLLSFCRRDDVRIGSMSTWIGSLTFSLYHVVFCLAQAATIVRPPRSAGGHHDHDGGMSSSMMQSTSSIPFTAQLAAVGIICAAPVFLWPLQRHIPAVYPTTDLFLAPFLAHLASAIDEKLHQLQLQAQEQEQIRQSTLLLESTMDTTSTYGAGVVVVEEEAADDTAVFWATFCACMSLGGFLTSGILCILASRFRLANLGSFLPYTVLCGFFTAIGLLMWTLAFSIDTGGLHLWTVLTSHNVALQQRALLHHVPSLLVGICMHVAGPQHPAAVMILVAMTCVGAYAIMFLTNTSLQQAQDEQWFFAAATAVASRDLHVVNPLSSTTTATAAATTIPRMLSAMNASITAAANTTKTAARAWNVTRNTTGATIRTAAALNATVTAATAWNVMRNTTGATILTAALNATPATTTNTTTAAWNTTTATTPSRGSSSSSISNRWNVWQSFGPPYPFGVWNAIWQGQVCWPAFMAGIPSMLALSVLYVIRCSLHAAALKKNIPNVTRKQQAQEAAPSPSTSVPTAVHHSPALSSSNNNTPRAKGKTPHPLYDNPDNDNENKHKDESASDASQDNVSMDASLRSFVGDASVSPVQQQQQQQQQQHASSDKIPSRPLPPLPLAFILEHGYGYSQIVAALVGGIPVSPAIAASVSLFQLGAEHAAPQYGSCLLVLFFFMTDFSFVQYIPKPAFSCLLVLAGLDMCKTWLIGSFFKTKAKVEWMIAPLLVVLTFVVGMLQAIALGVAVSTFLFVANFYRAGTVKFVGNGLTLRSTVERGVQETMWLDQNADQIQILVLHNYLFFGNAQSLYTYISTMFEDDDAAIAKQGEEEVAMQAAWGYAHADNYTPPLPPTPKYIIVDFQLVTGMDTSAIDLFREISDLCKENSCRLFLAGLSPNIKSMLLYAGLKPDSSKRLAFAMDLETALGKAEDGLITSGLNLEERAEREANLRRRQRNFSNQEDGFVYALRKIDEYHGLQTALELRGFGQFTHALELEPGELLFRDPDADHGLYFVETGLMRVRPMSGLSTMNIPTRATVRAPAPRVTNFADVAYNKNNAGAATTATLGHLNARSSSLGRRTALWKEERRRYEQSVQSFRLARVGQGWIIGAVEASNGMKRPGIHVAMSHCRLHHLPYSAIKEAEESNPAMTMHLYKTLSYLATKRQEMTIEQLGQFIRIMNSPIPNLRVGAKVQGLYS